MRRLIEKAFDEKNFQVIKDAVIEAEQGTSGQIVPFVVDRSSDYEEASSKAFFCAVVIVAIALAGYEWRDDLWLPQFKMGVPLLVILILLLGGMLSSTLIHWIPSLKRILLGKNRLHAATHRRARIAFLDNEVFRTKNRTGILIFISLFEHQVHVVADKGLHDKVDASQWNQVVGLIIEGIKDQKPAEGMIRGIEKCGEILRQFSPRTSGEENELPDELKMGKFTS